jgi:Protein of unknown function (DUF2933)
MPTEQIGFIGWLKSRTGLVFLGFAAIALFFLWEEHKAHILGFLPYVFITAVSPLAFVSWGARISRRCG